MAPAFLGERQDHRFGQRQRHRRLDRKEFPRSPSVLAYR
jgi:hypothetical protein